MLNTPQQIQDAKVLTLRQMLILEIKGMTRSRAPSAYAMLKGMGYRGTRQQVLEQLNADRAAILGT